MKLAYVLGSSLSGLPLRIARHCHHPPSCPRSGMRVCRKNRRPAHRDRRLRVAVPSPPPGTVVGQDDAGTSKQREFGSEVSTARARTTAPPATSTSNGGGTIGKFGSAVREFHYIGPAGCGRLLRCVRRPRAAANVVPIRGRGRPRTGLRLVAADTQSVESQPCWSAKRTISVRLRSPSLSAIRVL
jgi:hypothetical protein